MAEYIDREAALNVNFKIPTSLMERKLTTARKAVQEYANEIAKIPAADVRPVSEIEKIIESLQEQADIYNARAHELLVEEDGQVSQYTWAVSLRETYRRIIKALDDLIS